MPNVIVVGAGNAGLCAALAAAEQGAAVTLVERAPRAERGGNSAFTAGAMRVTYDGPADLRLLMPELTEAEWEGNDFGTYTSQSGSLPSGNSSRNRRGAARKNHSRITIFRELMTLRGLNRTCELDVGYRQHATRAGARDAS